MLKPFSSISTAHNFNVREDWKSVAIQQALYPAQWTILSYSLPAQNADKGISSYASEIAGKCLFDNLPLLVLRQEEEEKGIRRFKVLLNFKNVSAI